jgi:glycosyltransferase involved in cell wall biosynthesis
MHVGKAQVRYVAPEAARRGAIHALVRQTPHELLYLNSFFHAGYTLGPLTARRLGRLRVPRVLVAPRGELGRGALQLKAWKKRPFVALSRLVGLHAGLAWHATSEAERDDIRREVSGDALVFVAPNLGTQAFLAPAATARPAKVAGSARLVFASRVMRKKNLAHLLEALPHVRGEVSLDVYGPLEDAGYWDECLRLAQALPANVSFAHRGAVAAERMPSVLDEYHVFVLPTLNENYGHAIVEALARGLPAVISDATPWNDLAAEGAGTVVALGDPRRLAAAVQGYVDMPAGAFAERSQRAAAYGRARIDDHAAAEATRRMLATCAGAAAGSA